MAWAMATLKRDGYGLLNEYWKIKHFLSTFVAMHDETICLLNIII